MRQHTVHSSRASRDSHGETERDSQDTSAPVQQSVMPGVATTQLHALQAAGGNLALHGLGKASAAEAEYGAGGDPKAMGPAPSEDAGAAGSQPVHEGGDPAATVQGELSGGATPTGDIEVDASGAGAGGEAGAEASGEAGTTATQPGGASGGGASGAAPEQSGASGGGASGAAPEQSGASGGAAPAREAKAESSRAAGSVPVLSGGGGRSLGGDQIVSGGDKAPKAQVAATGKPKENGSAGKNTCSPHDVSGGNVTWSLVKNTMSYGVKVTGFWTSGDVNLDPWPSKPSAMEVPNTANAVDGGNINNDKTSDNYWKSAIADMEDYHKAGGGAGPHWHSAAASKAHEWKHWDYDWMQLCVAKLWPTYNAKLDALWVSRVWYNATTGKAALQKEVNRLMKEFDGKLTTAWNAIPDSPGVAGSNGYDAGQAVLNGLISQVRSYAKGKGWDKEKKEEKKEDADKKDADKK